jgi:hypothetical protein
MSKRLIGRGAQWVEQMGQARPEVLRIGYFGSYTRGDWGVGSDLDLIIAVERADQPFERRGARWDIAELPVPADVLVYTEEEWDLLGRQGKRFYRTVMMEGCRVWERQAARYARSNRAGSPVDLSSSRSRGRVGGCGSRRVGG